MLNESDNKLQATVNNHTLKKTKLHVSTKFLKNHLTFFNDIFYSFSHKYVQNCAKQY